VGGTEKDQRPIDARDDRVAAREPRAGKKVGEGNKDGDQKSGLRQDLWERKGVEKGAVATRGGS